MDNYAIRINLSRLNGAFLTILKGKTASKTCLCIPVEENHVFQGEQGCYLSLAAIQSNSSKFGDSHILRLNMPKEEYEKLTDEQRAARPIVGNMRPLYPQTAGNTQIEDAQPEDDESLPF